MLTGYATPSATAAHAAAHPDLPFLPLGRTGLHVAAAGFGTYRVNIENPLFRSALEKALQSGINLIDTSSNYADGGSEQLIGITLEALVSAGHCRREEIVIVSKAGYLQGHNYQLAQQRAAAGNPFPDLVPYAADLFHCIHPQFLEDQLTRTLQRLQVECVDVYLLHNPEYYLAWAEQNGISSTEAQQIFADRITSAFQWLETAVTSGRIRSYGISSNTFPAPTASPTFNSLERCLAIAAEISPEHHFQVVQFPMNLLETGAATEHNQESGATLLECCQAAELGVLINRPLNAFTNNRLIRLAELSTMVDSSLNMAELSTAVDSLVHCETAVIECFSQLRLTSEVSAKINNLLSVGRTLHWRWPSFDSYHNWIETKEYFLIPRAQMGIDYLREEALLPVVEERMPRYIKQFNETLALLDHYYITQSQMRARAILQMVNEIQPAWQTGHLSQTALRALRSTSGISCVLVGMRRPAYVTDVLIELQQPITRQSYQETWSALAETIPTEAIL